MQLSKTCDLFLKDLFFYDIRSCYYQIANSVSYDLGDIEVDNKEQRNIAIGKEQIGNPGLTDYFANTASATVNYYLTKNNVKPEEIILTQRDGCIVTKLLNQDGSFMNMDLRAHYNFMIITPDRKKYLAASDEEVTVKGVPNKYDKLDKVYNKFKDLNFYDKKQLFKQFKRIKELVTESDDSMLYIIERDLDKFVIYRKHGIIQLKGNSDISTKGIDKQKYYDLYFSEFMQVLFLYFK
jgi:hypothetical protein